MRIIYTLLVALLLYNTGRTQDIPDFTLTDTKGNTYQLYEELQNGKTIVIDFFGLQCGSCQTDMGALEAIWQNNGAENGDLWIWAIESLGGTNTEVESFVSINGGTFPSFTHEPGDSLLELFQVSIIPSYYVICPTGQVKKSSIDNLPNYINACGSINSIVSGSESHSQITSIISGNTSFINIEFDLISASKIDFELYDLLGNKITSKSRYYSGGQNAVTINRAGLTRGYYLIRMTDHKAFMETKRIMLN